ncbi:MAG: HAMP domain-containing protein [Phycisphaerales bacterium]|nr:HAMP domain-containing protein [Phycisphaerales bacterium]MCB9863872.1 HAMP domain-containing protein [Phycisphaerales bacterium]
MSIRTKCALLLIAFEATLAGTILFTLFYTTVYFGEAAQSFSVSRVTVDEIGRLRSAVLNEKARVEAADARPADREDLARSETDISRLVANLGAALDVGDRERLESLNERRRTSVRVAMDRAREVQAADASVAVHHEFDQFLGQLEAKTWESVRLAVEQTTEAQSTTAIVLTTTMTIGALLGVAGIWLVRRWVLVPVQDLKVAADDLGRGHRDNPAKVSSADELGQLAIAFNKMAADLGVMEKRMVQRERLAAMGELVSYITHNIRNPLAGIQSSAEITCQHATPDSPIVEQQRNIIRAIERFLRWLRQIEHACGGPLDIETEPTDIHELIDAVVSVFRPMADQDDVTIVATHNGAPHCVPLDPRQFEQALTAVVGNAIEAVGKRGRVTISVAVADDAEHWELAVTDTGPGVPADVREHVFEPTFSTKRHGHGLGLALARKIAELHGGELECDDNPRGGAVFRFIMPIEPHEDS